MLSIETIATFESKKGNGEAPGAYLHVQALRIFSLQPGEFLRCLPFLPLLVWVPLSPPHLCTWGTYPTPGEVEQILLKEKHHPPGPVSHPD